MKRTIRFIFLLAVALLATRGFAGSLADVTVYDRAEQRTLPVYWFHGKAYVVGRPGNEYQIALRNREGEDVLAIVSVDGVNVVTGETASAGQSGYVLESGNSFEIKGWRKNLSRTAAFYFTELPDSYAARTGRPDNVGVIGVALFRRKPEAIAEPAYPAPAAPLASNAARADGYARERAEAAPGGAEPREKSLGTGHGRAETSYARYVGFERASNAPDEVITLYYDSYANLVARGIIRPAAPHGVPQPFPAGFVADPPRRW